MTFLQTLKDAGIRFFTGVPDSTLRAFCWSLEDDAQITHIRSTSEGGAVGLAIGYAISSKAVPCVYMQNSGLPNALNPLLSLGAEQVFDVSMLLVIGWRAQPGRHDEPQHQLVGKHTLDLLRILEIEPYVLTNENLAGVASYLENLRVRRRCAIVVGTDVKLPEKELRPIVVAVPKTKLVDKEAALAEIACSARTDEIFVAGIGHTSRELMNLRRRMSQDEARDLWCVGGMGYASSVAIGICLNAGGRRIYCLDGDGAFLMHGLTNCAVHSIRTSPYTHIIFDNGVHASVGGQPIAVDLDLARLGPELGYLQTLKASSLEELREALARACGITGPSLISVRVTSSGKTDLPRPEIPIPHAVARFREQHGFC